MLWMCLGVTTLPPSLSLLWPCTLVNPTSPTPQALVVAPSQELAMQIARVAQGLFPKDSRTAVQQAIGGANLRRQAEAIAEHQPILVVGTPGRVVDLVG